MNSHTIFDNEGQAIVNDETELDNDTNRSEPISHSGENVYQTICNLLLPIGMDIKHCQLLFEVVSTTDSGTDMIKCMREGEGVEGISCVLHNFMNGMKFGFKHSFGMLLIV